MKNLLNKRYRINTQKRPFLSLQLYVYFSIFAIIVIALLWIFQTLLLDNFYQAIRMRELRDAADFIAYHADSYDVQAVVENVAVGNDVCIIVFDGTGKKVASADVKEECVIHHTDSDTINNFYVEAKASKKLESVKEINLTTADGKQISDSIVMTKIVKSPEHNNYIILLNAVVVPVSATVHTLQIQLTWVSIITIVLGMIFAVVISRTISRPISKLNKSAKALAHGYYGADFSLNLGCREVGELSDTLAYAARELSKADKMQKELIANISHDLRTPLTLIKGYGEVMRDIPGEMTPDNMQVIIDETERLSSLVSDLVDMSKFQSGDTQLSLDTFDLGDTVRETIERYVKLTERDGYSIELNCSEPLPVYADKTRILQVIYNLINNAINYTGEDRKIYVSAYCISDSVRVEVKDTGEGIEADKLALIWDRYYKIDKVHRRATVGTGLGLSIVKNILVMHGAKYGVDSVIGQGSVFWFELKLADNKTKGEQDNGKL